MTETKFGTDQPTTGQENIATQAREGETLPSVFIIYRDNDLFAAHMQTVVAELKAKGRQVLTQVFPASTEQKEISQWIEDNTASLGNAEVITDGTCNAARFKSKIKPLIKIETQSVALDDLFQQASIDALSKQNPELNPTGAGYDFGERTLAAISTLTKLIIENPQNKPGHVLVFQSNILSHMRNDKQYMLAVIDRVIEKHGGNNFIKFECEDVRPKVENGNREAFYMSSITNEHDIISEIEQGECESGKKLIEDAFGRLKRALTVAGIPEEAVTLVKDPMTVTTLATDEKRWLMYDRHAKREMGGIDGIHLKLPFENMIQDAISLGLVKIDPKKITEALKEKLK